MISCIQQKLSRNTPKQSSVSSLDPFNGPSQVNIGSISVQGVTRAELTSRSQMLSSIVQDVNRSVLVPAIWNDWILADPHELWTFYCIK